MSARPAALPVKNFPVARQSEPSPQSGKQPSEGNKHKKQFSHEKDSIIIILCGSLEHMLACAVEAGFHHRYLSYVEKYVRVDMELLEAI